MEGLPDLNELQTEDDVLQVSLICPDISVESIRSDLLITKNTELTINRILDGTVTGVGDTKNSTSTYGIYVGPSVSTGQSSNRNDCSSTDVNSDSEVESPVKLNNVKSIRKESSCSGTDVNSDDHDDIEIVSVNKLQADQRQTTDIKPTGHMSTMYGEHCMSDDSDLGEGTASVAGSKPMSHSSDDELTSVERKPLSELLGFNAIKGNNQCSYKQDFNLDEEELPDLDLASTVSRESSLLNLETASNSQTSTWSTTSDASSSSKGKKKRRTPEEIEDSKKLAMDRKAQREQDKREREERKKRETVARKAVQEAKKQTRPGDCMKYITVAVDLGLINNGPGPAVLAGFEDSPVKCVAESLPVPNTIIWRRLMIEHQVSDEARLETMETEQRESEVLLILSTSEFVQVAHNSKQAQSGCPTEGPTLIGQVQHVQEVYTGCNLTLIALGMDQYFRDMKTEIQRKHRNAVRGNSSDAAPKKRAKTHNSTGIVMSRIEVEEVLVVLSLETCCNYQLVDSSKDLVTLVKTFTKAVGEAPSKKNRLESAFSFHCEGGGVGKVDKNGVGLLKVWKQQLQQFKTISAEMANAIVASYPSPRMLVEAYRQCCSEREAERLLEDIVVRRGAGALTTSRRIGKELSRRVYQLMSYTDPEFIIT